MKKILFTLACCFVGWTMQSQTIVSPDPSNKNVIIEEFTGACCAYCPDAHRRVADIMDKNPGRVWGINIHAGLFAISDDCEERFLTADGDTIHVYFYPQIKGYPTGTVNRDSITMRNTWDTKTSARLAEPSYLNVASQGTVDWTTRTLTLLVEVYYTNNSPVPTNFLTVALLQNNVEGIQFGSDYNPSQVLLNGNYNHMHMLRDIISPTWGDTIVSTTQGSFYSKTYTYTIPESINTVDVFLENIEILAYVTETKETIISGTKAALTLTNQPEKIMAIDIADMFLYLNSCDESYELTMTAKNRGTDTVNTISYNIFRDNQMIQNKIWNARKINPNSYDTIKIPLSLTGNTNTTFKMEIVEINGETVSFSSKDLVILKNVVMNGGGNMTLKIVTDAYASETYYSIYDESGNRILDNWSNLWPDLSDGGTTEHLIDFHPSAIGCYTVLIEDEFGDGINNGYGAGYIELLAEDGSRLFYNDGKFGSHLLFYVYAAKQIPVTDIIASSNITIFPNPANDRITILSDNATIQKVELYNLQGQLIKNQQLNNNTLDISDLSTGMYSVRIITEKGVAVKNIIKK